MTGMRQFVIAMAGILVGMPGLAYLLARDLGIVTQATVTHFAFIIAPAIVVVLIVLVIERSGVDVLADDAEHERVMRDERRVRAELRTSREVVAVPADRTTA